MSVQSEDEISRALGERSKHFILESLKCGGDRKLAALKLAIHASLAGWVLAEATVEQALEIHQRYKPASDRN